MILDEIGAPYWDALEPAGVPWQALDRPEIRYSLPAAYTLLDGLARREGIDDLAFSGSNRETMAAMEPNLQRLFLTACTLMVAVSRYARLVRRYNGRQSRFVIGRDVCWYLVRTDKRVAAESWNRYSDWSNLIIPINVVREALGAFWCPTKIWLQTKTPLGNVVHEAFPNTEIRTGMAWSGFTIPTRKLSWRMTLSRDIIGQQSSGASDLPLDMKELSFSSTLSELIAPFLGDERLSVDFAAELARTSTRSMQRKLAADGTSWRQLRRDAGFERAAALLRSGDVRVIDISTELGYSSPSHFSRAFRQTAGVSPIEYRRQYH